MNPTAERQPLCAALIGAGGIAAATHMPAHLALSGSRLKWVMDVREESARDLAERHGVPRSTARYEEVLADPEVDWVDITTPNGTHAALANQALRAGKHVLVQKPMASSVADARSMLETARECGRSLSVFMCFRGDPGILAIRSLIQSGALGGIISVRGKMISGTGLAAGQGGWRSEEGVGGLMQLGVHILDLFDLLIGPARWVEAEVKTLYSPMKGDDAAFALVGLDGGMTGMLEATYCSFTAPDTPLYTLDIGGTDGFVHYRLETGQMQVQLRRDTAVGPYAYRAGSGVCALAFEPALGGGSCHVAHQSFVDRLLAGEPDYAGAEAGIRALEAADAILRASQLGRRIAL